MDPLQAREFVPRTGIDALAPAVGTAHGLYRGVPRIALDLISAIRDSVNVPLVLHGGSDLSEALLRQAIRAGIRKVNVGTDLQVAHAKALRRALASDHVAPNMRVVHAAAAAAVCDVARAKIRICSGICQDFCGSSGKGGPHPQFPWVLRARPITCGFSTMHYPHPWTFLGVWARIACAPTWCGGIGLGATCQYRKGILTHSAMNVTTDGVALGLLGQKLRSRPLGEIGRYDLPRSRTCGVLLRLSGAPGHPVRF